MDQEERRDYFGELLFDKISSTPGFANYTNYFSKIVGIILDFDDDIIYKFLQNDLYFQKQVFEIIILLKENENQQK